MRMQKPITVPYDRSLRPETTYLPFNNINNYGPIDIRVADNYTGNQPSQVCVTPPLLSFGRCPRPTCHSTISMAMAFFLFTPAQSHLRCTISSQGFTQDVVLGHAPSEGTV